MLDQPDLFVRSWVHESDCVKSYRTNTNIGCARSIRVLSEPHREPDAAVLCEPDRVNHNRTDQTERTKQTIRYTNVQIRHNLSRAE